MISLAEAQQRIIDNVQPLQAVERSISTALNHVAARNIVSAMNVPSFTRSAMDGFAVASAMISKYPITLKIGGTVFAGDIPQPELDSSKAMKIMTGAPVPDQYDAVVKLEDTEYDDYRVTIKKPVKEGEFIRSPGEDIAVGETLLHEGDVVHPVYAGILASVGLERITVIAKPRLLVLSTGNELRPEGESLEYGQIYDSNSYTIDTMTNPFRASIDKRVAIEDEVSTLEQELLSDHDVIVSTGGVSMGDRDYLPLVAQKCGWKPLFHRVAVKPGKPVFVAVRERQILFGLPGNPLSTAVTCALFVVPGLKKMMGLKECLPQLMNATMETPDPFNCERTVVWPGKIKQIKDLAQVTLATKHSSAALSALIGSDGLIYIFRGNQEGQSKIKAVTWPQILHLQ